MFQIVRECCAYLQLSEPLCNGAIVLVVHLHCSSHHLAHLTYPLHLALHLLENSQRKRGSLKLNSFLHDQNVS